VIQMAFKDTSSTFYHLTPFRLFWKPTADTEPERVVTELYNSDAFLDEYEKLQHQPKEPGCDLERVIAALMVWSDSTHLANFGQASLWPIYIFFGNQSKYSRAKPSHFAAHHLAYLPSVM
jgi:Plavaka transposase